MSHPDEGTIQMLLDGELGPDERARVEAHARSCPACAARIEEARAFMVEADRLVNVLAVPARAVAPAALRRRTPALRALAWAASVLLAVGLGYYGRGAAPPRQDERLAGDRQAQANPTVSGPAVPPPTESTNLPVPVRATTPPRQGAAVSPAAERPVQDAQASRAGEIKQVGGATPPPAAPNATMEREAPASRDAAAPAANAVAAKTVAADSRADLAAAGGRAEPASGWRVIALEEAVRILGGQIRLIDGLSPERVETGPGTAVAGADPAAAVVRVVYSAGAIVLDEQREGKAESAGRLDAAQAPARVVTAPSIGWREAGAIRFAVTGSVSPDSLTALAGRVR